MSSVKIIEAGESGSVADPAAVSGAAARPAPELVAAAAPVAAPRPTEILARSGDRKTATLLMPSGRPVSVRRLSALDRMIAAKAIGSELVTNALYANYALVACSVTAIAGDPVSPPTSNRAIEVIIQRLGDDFDDLTELMKDAFSLDEADPFDPATVKN